MQTYIIHTILFLLSMSAFFSWKGLYQKDNLNLKSMIKLILVLTIVVAAGMISKVPPKDFVDVAINAGLSLVAVIGGFFLAKRIIISLFPFNKESLFGSTMQMGLLFLAFAIYTIPVFGFGMARWWIIGAIVVLFVFNLLDNKGVFH